MVRDSKLTDKINLRDDHSPGPFYPRTPSLSDNFTVLRVTGSFYPSSL